ncbi:PepSY-associated TM helix domain-containing protein [Sphingobium fluviale]|uniref:PepSY-associated TM helix domain-containing protein n=1 Tax=Sphingobium fluviale TaxID=2506423 RepID=UPI0024826AB3|nr:PepSY-associated TM helix domain-containing protein [Sphingobium fluviale]
MNRALRPDGSLQVETKGPSPVAQFIDVLHQQVGLPLDHEVAMPIMGAIAMLYFVAIVSGLIVLLPSLVSDLFAMRLGKNVKRMWLDAHNLLGIFSLPFHIIMAVTALVFAFHDQFYGAQGLAFGGAERQRPAAVAQGDAPPMLTPVQMVARLRQQAPDFTPLVLDISQRPDGSRFVRVGGLSERHAMRGPTMGYGSIDPVTGDLTGKDYMPGHQDGWSAAVTSFFTLHFGAFGGEPIRWSYFLLGLAGAFIFYTGNLLWIESRRKRERKAGAVEQTRATKVLGALTVGVPTGTIAGIAVTLAAAKPLGASATEGLHSAIFYALLLGFIVVALLRGAARSGHELTYAAATMTFCVPIATLLLRGLHPAQVLGVDATAVILGCLLIVAGRAAKRRARSIPGDSIWAATKVPQTSAASLAT